MPGRATKRKRGRRAFSSFFALHPAHPPSIRFSFITTAAVYVFATARSTEATSSFTLEMKALHRRTGGRKGAWEWFFIGTSYKAILHSPLLCTEAVTDFLFLPWSSRAQDVPPSFSLSFPSSSATFRLCGNLSTSFHAALFPPFSSSMNVSRPCFYMVSPVRPSIEQITFWVASPTCLPLLSSTPFFFSRPSQSLTLFHRLCSPAL